MNNTQFQKTLTLEDTDDKKLLELQIAITDAELRIVARKKDLFEAQQKAKKMIKDAKLKLKIARLNARRKKCHLYDYRYKQTAKGKAAQKRKYEKRHKIN